MKEILIPLNFTATPVLYDSKQSFSASDESSGVLTFTTTANVTGTVASLTLRNASDNANRQTILVERLDINSSPFSYIIVKPLPFGNYEGEITLKKGTQIVASAVFLFGVNSSLSASVLPKLVEAYSLDALVEEVETEVSNLKDAYNLTVSETVKGVNKTESKLQASENVRYLNEDTRKNNNSLWKAQAEAFALAEENRVIEFNDLVDSAVIEQTVTQEVAEKYQEIVSLNAQEMVSFRQQLADIKMNKADIADLPSSAYTFKGSTTFASLPTTGNTLGDVRWTTDKRVNYAWTGTAWTPIGNGAFTNGSVTNEKLADGAVSPINTDFLIQNVNIFDKDAIITGGYYNDWGGWTVNVDRISTPFMKIIGGATYPTNSTYFGYLTFYDANKTRVAGYGVGAWSSPIVAPANAVYITIMYTTAYDLSTLMICKDTLPGAYVPYGFVLSDFLDVSEKIKTETQTNIDASWENNIALKLITKNLFDKTKIITGKEVYSSGTLSNEANSAVIDDVPVSGFASIYVSGLTAYANGIARNCFFYDANKTPIAGTLQQIPAAATEKQITVPSGAVIFAMSIYQRKKSGETVNLDTIQIEKGIVKTAYEPYTLGINTISGYDFSRAVPPKTAGKNFLFFGDSITETATVSDDGATYTEGTRQNWPTFSKQYLQMGQMWNYAKSGGHFVDGYLPSGVIRQQLSTQISTAIANSRPADIIVVSAGTNDDSGSLVLSNYATIMAKSIETLDRTNFGEAVRWCFYTLRNAYPNAKCFYATPIQTASKELNQNMIDLLVKLAKRYNFVVIDGQNESGIVREFETVGRYLSDGLHPNTAGQQLMSKLYNRVILNALNDAN